MPERAATVAAILERAEQVHGVVTGKTEGADPEWPLFYAWWLLRWSDLPEALAPASPPTISELAGLLIELDRDFRRGSPNARSPRAAAGRRPTARAPLRIAHHTPPPPVLRLDALTADGRRPVQ